MALLLGALLAAPAPAAAQRGASFLDHAASPVTPTDDFPGLFDTNLAASGKGAVSLPWLSLSALG